jgi:predicted RND superfamily exporter protein
MSLTLGILFASLLILVLWLLYRYYLRERKVRELKRQQELTDNRLEVIEHLIFENPVLLLAFADAWIENMRHGSNQSGLEGDVLAVLEQVCELTDTPYWPARVGRKLKKLKKFVKSKDHPDDDLLRRINNLTDRYDIELDRV